MTVVAAKSTAYSQVADKYRLLAKDTFGSLDRSSLGSFAIENDWLVAIAAREWLDMDSKQSIDDGQMQDAQWTLDDDIMKTVKGHSTTYLGLFPLRAEALLWFEKSGLDILRKYAERTRTQGDRRLAAQIDRIHLVFDNPERLRYFESDIWDMKLIDRLITDGIDASMANEMSGIPDSRRMAGSWD